MQPLRDIRGPNSSGQFIEYDYQRNDDPSKTENAIQAQDVEQNYKLLTSVFMTFLTIMIVQEKEEKKHDNNTKIQQFLMKNSQKYSKSGQNGPPGV